MNPTKTLGGYVASKLPDGTMVVHDVPIFVECERGEMQFGKEWIEAAVEKAKQAESEGYLPPLHIRHHEAGTEVKASGFFRITGTRNITFKGEKRLAVLADLHITDPDTQAEVMSKRLPYRSVEIMNVDKPALDSLALLDHEAPFLELPMLVVSQIQRGTASANLSASSSLTHHPEGATCDAYFRRGAVRNLLFKVGDNAMDETQPGQAVAQEPKPEQKQQAEPSDGGVGAMVKAIIDALLPILTAQLTKAKEPEPTEQKPSADPNKPAPAAAPGGESMSKDTEELSVKMAALAGENQAMKARLDTMAAEAERKEAVAVALKRLEGRPLGADLETKLAAFHKEHGAKAFAAYVDSMATTFAAVPSDRAGSFSANTVVNTAEMSDAVKAYEKDGPTAVEQALKFSREWNTQRQYGLRTSEKSYIEHQMKKARTASKV